MCINPLGTVYNVVSILNTLKIILKEIELNDEYFFNEGGIYKSFYLHSSISHSDINELKKILLHKINVANNYITKSKWIFITLGTSYVYRHKSLNIIVSNCHKQPTCVFDNYLLSVEETYNYLEEIIIKIKNINANCKIIVTISPVRYLKYGAFGNTLSKSTLFLAISKLLSVYSDVIYFPAYEIFIDELRDYRYYALDMVHPGEAGIEYLWERFCTVFFDAETLEEMNEIRRVLLSLEHKPIFKESEQYKEFKKTLSEKIIELKHKYPYLDFEEEIKMIH